MLPKNSEESSIHRTAQTTFVRAILLVRTSDWTFSFSTWQRPTLTSFCSLHGRFPNRGALEQSWALKWSLGLMWYFDCSFRYIGHDVSARPSLLERMFYFGVKCSAAFYFKSKIQISEFKSWFSNWTHAIGHCIPTLRNVCTACLASSFRASSSAPVSVEFLYFP